jgi:hypothetical protein
MDRTLVERMTGIGVVSSETDLVVEGNRFCGNDRNLVVQGSEAALDPSNEICESAGP